MYNSTVSVLKEKSYVPEHAVKQYQSSYRVFVYSITHVIYTLDATDTIPASSKGAEILCFDRQLQKTLNRIPSSERLSVGREPS
jgi:hypothetical protein